MASILNEFYIVFKAKTEALKKGYDEVKRGAKNIQSQLDKMLGINKKVSDSFQHLGRSLTGLVAGALSIHSLASNLKSAFDYASDLDLASRTLDVNRQELEAWGYAVQRTGGNIKTFESSLTGLAKHLNASLPNTLRFLPILAEGLSKLSATRALQYGEMLGLDVSTITFLRQGRTEVERLIKAQQDLGLVTDESTKKAREFNFAWLDAKHGLTTAFTDLENQFLPTLTILATKLTDFTKLLQKNTDLMTGALIGVGLVAARVLLPLLLPFAPLIAAILGTSLVYNELAKTYRSRYEDNRYLDVEKNKPVNSFNRIFRRQRFDYQQKQEQADAIAQANSTFNLAASSPINKAPTNSSTVNHNESSVAKEVNVTVGDVIVHTQAVDAKNLSNEIGKTLNEQIRQAISTIDDGVVV